MQCISKMLEAPVIAAENLILVPAKAFKSRQAALDALRALCAAPSTQGGTLERREVSLDDAAGSLP
jgi:hypothetical protein